MKDTLIAQIQSFTLQARAALESEAGRQLEGIYGWLPDGRFADTTHYSAVNEIPEATENRRCLEAYAEEEKTAGLSPKAARIKLVREAAFTWLNRLVALRMMEERKIIKSTVGKLDKSNSFIFWLTADGNDEMYALHQQGALPQNAMNEGPSDVAYRKFLLWQCTQLARDVSVLFDPENLSSRLFPRPPVLKLIVEFMNREDMVEAWQTGNEETIGWVYEAFNAEEEAVIRASFLNKHKVTPNEIPAVTQLFTPRWVVRLLVENTLGRIWVEMHPDSRLKDQLTYLVPFNGSARALKPAKNITFLDPSCGSMHFGLVAFDLLVEMYKEELERVGQPGWPERPSVASVEEIPTNIIANNIYGIDIDLRAVQLSALTLLLKARTLNKECTFSDRNLACANVEAITGGKLEAFISRSKFSHPIYERILRAMALSLKDSEQLGSLLRLEITLEYLIAEERKKEDANKQLQLSFPGVTQEQFATREGVQEFFDILHEHILRHLDNFVKESRNREIDPGHFVSETAKGLRFLGIVSSQYDVVATNPPYLDSRDYSQVHKKFLEKVYPDSKRNLFAAFIERCSELVRKDGFVGMITGQSFMFIKTYEELRKKLLESCIIQTLAQFDYNLFKGRVDTSAFVLCNKTISKKRQAHQGTYFRLLRESDSEAKRIAFEDGLAALKAGRPHPLVFTYRQEDFDAIPGKPWVYWNPPPVRDIFRTKPPIGSNCSVCIGMRTGENTRFLRRWWEIGLNRINRSCFSGRASLESNLKWYPYNKGSGFCRWYGPSTYIVEWKNNGKIIKQNTRQNYPQLGDNLGWKISNEDKYFLSGVSYSSLTASIFSARITPPGYLFDVSGSTVFGGDNLLVVAVLNSNPGRFFLDLLNPTVNFQVGDIARVPMPANSSPLLTSLVEKVVLICERDSSAEEITYGFINPPISVAQVEKHPAQLCTIEDEIDKEVTRLYGLTEEDRLALKAELEGTVLASNDDDDEATAEKGDEEDANESAWTESALARAWISYAFGTMLNRYAIGEPEGLGRGTFDEETNVAIHALIDADGVMVSEPGHPQDITVRTHRCLELMRGRETAHALIRKATGSEADPEESLRGFLDRFTGTPETSFWRHHFQLYRKRPIFWPLQSPKRKFTVWVFQERFTTDTLFKVRSEFADPKARWLEGRIKDLKAKADASAGAEKRGAEKEASQLAEILDDVQEFSKRLNAIIQKGYTPHIDDGVLINAAPLWELLSSWPDTKKAWQELEEEKYDWAHQAMDHWPDRVREKCKTNKSFAIAHGLEELCEG
ncbi:MAG: BREX-1 system adenine-specific DNA-methyltransferase PglX [Desulfobacterales bacterium]|nr:BREX-1 system adenine-specific DNA-methyltransferase PglX [Desulfobacterales bacterium]